MVEGRWGASAGIIPGQRVVKADLAILLPEVVCDTRLAKILRKAHSCIPRHWEALSCDRCQEH